MDSRLSGTLVAFLFVHHSLVFAQSTKDYLDALEGEAETITIDKATQPAKSESARQPQFDAGESGGIKALKPGLSIAQFTEILKNNYLGSHMFYVRMSNKQKQEVYKYYLDNPNLVKIRAKIIQISKR